MRIKTFVDEMSTDCSMINIIFFSSSSVFTKCHEAVDPQNYYAACVFDSCRIPDRNIECATLQIYAATCADQGVCIDWRKDTSGSCRKCIILTCS